MPHLHTSVGYLPGRSMANIEWARRCSLEGDVDLERMGGVGFRRIWADTQNPALHRLSWRAARHALGPRSPDLLVHMSTTPDALSPATAHRLHLELGLPSHTAACDVASSCTSVLSALRLASGQVLLVAAEAKSRHVAAGDSRTAALFGDAAVALRLDPGSRGQDEAIWLEPFVETELVGNITVEADSTGQQRLLMRNGKLMFRKTVAAMVTMIERAFVACHHAGWRLSRIYIHQANAHVLAEVKRHFREVFIPVLMHDIGNTVSVSLPLHRLRVLTLLALARRDARFCGAAEPLVRSALLEELGGGSVFRCEEPDGGVSSGLVCSYGDEKLVVLDSASSDASSGIGVRWLMQLSSHEWSAFFKELAWVDHCTGRPFAPSVEAEAWIGAGGGFQALGFVEPTKTRGGDPELIKAASWV